MSVQHITPDMTERLMPFRFADRLISLAERVPLAIPQIAARMALAKLFWDSAHSKLASWPVTVQLFANEYRVPLLPAETAAVLATGVEWTCALLIFFGLATRFAALSLLGLVAVIQLFVFPHLWGLHLFWATALLLLIIRGAGVISIDHALRRFIG